MTIDNKISILVIDDEVDYCDMVSHILKREGYSVFKANNAKTGLEIFNKHYPDIVILDLCIPDVDGINVLKQIKAINNETHIIIITAHGQIQSAVEAIKLGAYDYFPKPFDNEEIILTIKRAVEEISMRQEISILKSQLNIASPLFEQMGRSHEITKINELIECVASTNFTVIIYGETGSGKELVAREIHNRSKRKDKLFVVVDCGSIPETLIESELFGYEKGAFTGADQRKIGQFEMASGGTILLDEISNIPKCMQGKLLRVLQEHRIRRIGSNTEIDVDIRVVVAGNERLETLIESGRFRTDLYQRLNEFRIELPPLRQRKDDIIYLCKRFIDITNRELNKNISGVTKETLEMILTYDWPGNVRELKNVMRRAVLLATDIIEPKHILTNRQDQTNNIQQHINNIPDKTLTGGVISLNLNVKYKDDISLHDVVSNCVNSAEKQLITEVLKRTGGNKSKAAKILKIDYKTIHYKIKKYGININGSVEKER
ncbi:MAG TPA: sigma-54-dependent transcriptional regulator [Candidatus Wujingus californicus]|uniref:sigma-54-dependent transcriptional regulator n=1 Tax=Candidatus Wujingus californicus TaxID=3367618 RepID=UPI001D744EB8|nr:sigma-54-dependent Fis family transcriptional regulator [Planctomycetota bacterium]MDO8131286.1 sigma-54 dependent transcriptional regulator [Candidatus Brocadiales bacterium]